MQIASMIRPVRGILDRKMASKTPAPLSSLLHLLLLIAALPAAASAYTDPGTGALLWQSLAAGFVGLMFYARRIIRFFQKDRGAQKTPSTTSANQ
jgi:hypothetical protein